MRWLHTQLPRSASSQVSKCRMFKYFKDDEIDAHLRKSTWKTKKKILNKQTRIILGTDYNRISCKHLDELRNLGRSTCLHILAVTHEKYWSQIHVENTNCPSNNRTRLSQKTIGQYKLLEKICPSVLMVDLG